MTTSPTHSPDSPREVLRLHLSEAPAPGSPDGAWWPRSRDLQVEAPHLVDEFPDSVGRINRLLFSRPDWDDAAPEGRGARRVQAARGPVKVGSFPADDTHLMVLSMASGQRLKLVVIPSDTTGSEGARLLAAAGGKPGRSRSRSADEGHEDG